MFEDLIKKKENSVKIWGQKTLAKNRNKPVIIWDIKKHKSGPNSELWYAPAGFQRGKIKVPKNN